MKYKIVYLPYIFRKNLKEIKEHYEIKYLSKIKYCLSVYHVLFI